MRALYLPRLKEAGEENFRAVRDSLVGSISPALGQMLYHIAETIPGTIGQELRPECCSQAALEICKNAIFAINAETRTPRACFNYLHTSATNAAAAEFDKLIKQRRAESSAFDTAMTYADTSPEDFASKTTHEVLDGLQQKRKKELKDRGWYR